MRQCEKKNTKWIFAFPLHQWLGERAKVKSTLPYTFIDYLVTRVISQRSPFLYLYRVGDKRINMDYQWDDTDKGKRK